MKLVSKKDLIFITCIFLAVIVFSLVTGGNTIEVHFDNDQMSIEATGFEFNIAYEDIANAELTTLPELGTMDKGSDTTSLKCGNWNNALWGDYHLCVIPDVDSCVVVTLTDGRHVVFNYKEAENTEGVFSILQDYLEDIKAE